jgi:coiled-coil domain-containing protein 40
LFVVVIQDEEYKQAVKKRDALGVELYGVQQQLAKVHQSLEKSQKNYQDAKDKREQADSLLEQVTSTHKEKASAVDEAKTKCK